MGHANLTNLSSFFVNRLYANGKLSLRECAEAAAAKGETLHASEGEYEAAREIAMGVQDVVDFLANGNVGYVVADLSVWFGKKSKLSLTARQLLKTCELYHDEPSRLLIAADKLDDDGLDEWSRHVRHLTLMRDIHTDWLHDGDSFVEVEMPGEDGWLAFDHIPWRFAEGWRRRYRDIPILGNVTH